MNNRIYIISSDVCLNSAGKRKKLELLTNADLKPEFRAKLLESDLFAVFKGSMAKPLKTRQYINISENMLVSRQTLMKAIDDYEEKLKAKSTKE